MYIVCLNFDHCGATVNTNTLGPIVTVCPHCGSLCLQFENKHELIKTINSSKEQNEEYSAFLANILNKIINTEVK